MKSLFLSLKAAAAALLLLTVPLLCACAETRIPFPEYTQCTVQADFRLTVNGEPYLLHLEMAPLGEGDGSDFSEITAARLEIREPGALSEVCFLLEGNTTHLQAGEMTVPTGRELLGGICRILHCFSLTGNTIVEVKTAANTAALTSVTHRDCYGDFTVTYTETLAVTAIEFVYRQSLYRLTEIELQTRP